MALSKLTLVYSLHLPISLWIYSEHIYIEGNYFNGTIPNSLGELIHLLEFQFHDNDFTGKVSEDVCDLKEDFRAMWFTADCDSVFGSIECKCCDECYS